MTEIYSALKAAWHLDDIARLRKGQSIVPHHVYLSICGTCNQHCSFCSFRSPVGWMSEQFADEEGNINPKRKIPTEKCFEILDDCADIGVKAIQFTGGGEPSVHPDFEKIVSYALDRGFQVGLITNATRLLSAETILRLSWIRVSIDAGTRETYEATRKSKLWDRVLANVAYLTKINGPTIGANFVTTRENYRELIQFCELAKKLGCRYVKIAANLSTDGLAYYDGILDEIMELMAQTKALVDSDFTIANVFERRLEDLRLGRPVNAFCGKQRFSTYIGDNLKVYRCCNVSFTTHGEIGDLRRQSFKEWFLAESRSKFDGFDARSCVNCQFHEVNESIAYLVQKQPAHVEFV